MKRYGPAILTWIAFAVSLAATFAIVYRVVLPLLLKHVFSLSFPPKDDLSRAINWSVVGMVVILYYVFFTRTAIGQKLLQWFFDANRTFFLKGK
jgi:MFS-type transporter involved in bile tolerance (Atg22 family)